MARRQLLEFPSRTGTGTIQTRLYLPDDLAVSSGLMVQILHGMAEHMERYDAFCHYLAENGLAVCIHDQAGHGRSAQSAEMLGYFGEKDGSRLLLQDIDVAAALALQDLALLPGGQRDWQRVLLGHSMGSFICRSYCACTEMKLAGAIFSGTAGSNPAVALGLFLASRSIRKNGPLHKDQFLAKLTGMGFLKKIDRPRTAVDWLTRDEAIVDAYAADPYCGFTFTAAGYRDLYTWLQEISGRKWAAQLPATLPVLMFSGAQDPVGQYGRGPREVFSLLKETGHQVELKIYPDGRHEMLNEINRGEVWQDVLIWLQNLPATARTSQPGKTARTGEAGS